MTASRRHHYNPRYYLKRFESDSGQMWRLDKETEKIVCGNNNIFGLKSNWNNLDEPPAGYDRDWLEKNIAILDSRASRVLTDLVNGSFPDDIKPLAYAISFMQNHQPRLKRELLEQNPEQVAEWSDDHFTLVGYNTAMDRVEEYVPKSYWVWEIDQQNEYDRFLTSSNPLIDFTNFQSMLLPLSSRHCLSLNNDDSLSHVEPSFLTCDTDMVKGINDLTVKNSWQYVYSSTANF
jgi:Protein of unknown function (DUF4238)